jgi:hypothetical protein
MQRQMFRVARNTVRSPPHRDASMPPAAVREAAAPAEFVVHFWLATCHLMAALACCLQLPRCLHRCHSANRCAQSAADAALYFGLRSACRPAPQMPPGLPLPPLSHPSWPARLRPANPLREQRPQHLTPNVSPKLIYQQLWPQLPACHAATLFRSTASQPASRPPRTTAEQTRARHKLDETTLETGRHLWAGRRRPAQGCGPTCGPCPAGPASAPPAAPSATQRPPPPPPWPAPSPPAPCE